MNLYSLNFRNLSSCWCVDLVYHTSVGYKRERLRRLCGLWIKRSLFLSVLDRRARPDDVARGSDWVLSLCIVWIFALGSHFQQVPSHSLAFNF